MYNCGASFCQASVSKDGKCYMKKLCDHPFVHGRSQPPINASLDIPTLMAHPDASHYHRVSTSGECLCFRIPRV
jgi:hypothetical protein